MHRLGCLLGFVLLFSGCIDWRGPRHNASGRELEAVGHALDVWEEHGRPTPAGLNTCDAFGRIVIVVVTDSSTPCSAAANGCHLVVQPHVGAQLVLAIYVRDHLDEQARERVIVHEALHYSRTCVLRHLLSQTAEVDEYLWWGVPEEERGQVQRPDLADRRHQDRELWHVIEREAKRRLR